LEVCVSNSILHDLTPHQAAVLVDFDSKMSPTQATKRLHLRNGTIQGAIERGEIVPYRFPGSERIYVTPAMLAEWLEEYCRPVDHDLIPGGAR
jgi:hypothetical protein